MQVVPDADDNPTKLKRIVLDLEVLKTSNYIDNYGKAVEATLGAVLAHELVHILLTGYYDDGVGAPPDIFNGDETDYKGKTEKLSNEIYKEFGLPERNSYISRDNKGDVLSRDKEYTDGNKIDCSVAGDKYKKFMNLSHLGDSNDLVIGGKDDNEIITGGGNDYLYGMGGNDYLQGDDGDDHLHGGHGS